MKSIIQTNFDMVFIDSEVGIVRGLFIGIGISLPVAFFVLLLGTNNWVLATFAVLSIIGILASVLGTIKLLGWSLWYAESIAGVLCIGLSVDYSIHIGCGYAVAGDEGQLSRERRFEAAARRMGPVVVAACVTTAGSACFMFAGQLQFFLKMATLIFFTIIYSVIFALFFYLPLIFIAGPEGDFGKISDLVESCGSSVTVQVKSAKSVVEVEENGV
eukprot:augustus_masked-scaffold_2-processed-gene-20.44-mRNA-1 protein AED:1.00 eAED:1.00 QI:0/-1/0/0/-1/1/1/0/215